MAAVVLQAVKKKEQEERALSGGGQAAADVEEKQKGRHPAEPDETWSESRLFIHGIACSHKFEVFCGAIILFNMFLVILETDATAAEESPAAWMKVIAILLLAFYTCELSMKLFIFHHTFFYEPWNVLDFCIVGVDIILLLLGFIISNMPSVAILRVFKLVRLARAFKAAKQFQELHALIRSFGFAMKAIFWGILMIVMILTIWSILAVQLLHPINKRLVEQNPLLYEGCARCPDAFSSVFESNLTFFQHVVAGDSWGNVSLPIIREEPWTSIFFLMVLVTVNLTMLNLILAVIVEAGAKATEQDEHEKALTAHKRAHAAEARLIEICQTLDEDNSGSLNIDEFLHGFENNAEFADCLQAMNVSQSDIHMIFNICDEDGSGDVNYVEFVDQLRRIRRQGEQMLLYYVTEIRHKVQQLQLKEEQSEAKLTVPPSEADDSSQQLKVAATGDDRAETNGLQEKQQKDQAVGEAVIARPAAFAEQKAGGANPLQQVVPSAILAAPEPKAPLPQLMNQDAFEELALASPMRDNDSIISFAELAAGSKHASSGQEGASQAEGHTMLGAEQLERLVQINQEIASVMQDVVSQSKVHTGLLHSLTAEIPRPTTPEIKPPAANSSSSSNNNNCFGGRCCGPNTRQPVQLV